jgi:UDP-2-acetamido-3-amino-2,3-dideoxy-glucuronate N-acetyltransferase
LIAYEKSKTSLIESDSIGDKTRIHNFVHIMKGAVIGTECNICDYVFIEDGVVIGNRVTIKNMVQIWRGVVIGDDSFIGPSVVFTNDKNPRSKNTKFNLLKTIVEKKVSVGANSTILPGIKLGEGSVIGAGSVVTKDVDAYTVVYGNPARFVSRIILPG